MKRHALLAGLMAGVLVVGSSAVAEAQRHSGNRPGGHAGAGGYPGAGNGPGGNGGPGGHGGPGGGHGGPGAGHGQSGGPGGQCGPGDQCGPGGSNGAKHIIKAAMLFNNSDANGDNALTEGEVPAQVWARLSQADANADDAVTREEVAAMAASHLIGRFDSENGDGALAEDEVPENAWDHISQADTDNDGLVSEAELTAAILEKLNMTASELAEEKAARMIERFDSENGDGSLSEDEVPAELWAKISSADTNKDGLLSVQELAAKVLERLNSMDGAGHGHGNRPGRGAGNRPGHGQGRSAAMLFDRFDANADGELTEDEVPARVWTRVSAADTDGSGGVSEAEIDAFIASRHSGSRGK